MMPRRRFLKVAGASAAALAGLDAGAAQDAPRVPVVDTHLHCFAGPDDPRFPYHPRGPYRPDEPATPEHLLRCMDGAGVDFAVVVHPEPYQDDHRYLEHCLAVGKDRLKGTCLFFADQAGALDRMTALVEAHPGRIVAARVHAYAPDRLPPFGEPSLRAFWEHAGKLGLALQLHFEPRYAPGFEPLIRAFEQTPVIIDHLGRPLQGTPEEHAVVVGWSRFPNTILKVSSLPETRQYPHREIGPIIRQLAEAYGPNRLIYGGGYGPQATGDSYRAYRERVRSYLTGFGPAEQAKVLGGNAARLFKLG